MGQISIGGGISIGAGIILDGGPPPPPPVNTILPAVSGTAQSGYTLGVSTGTWDNNPTGYTYQWQHGTTNIAGATSSTYTLDATYAGETIRCVVTATNAVGSVSATSNSTAAVVAYPVNTVLPAISGNASVGNTLTVSTGTWNNSPTGYTYQWQYGTTDIAGATSSTYVIYGEYGGSTIRCKVTATNAIGSATAISAATSAVLGGPWLTAVAVITGTARNGQTLSVSTGTWTGTTPITFTYQWLHGSTSISGATSNTYTLDGSYVGETISCVVFATNIVASNTAYTAGPTAVVAPLAPVNTVAPAITGTARVGSTLTVGNGTWSNTPSSYAYQWKRAGTNISGATSSTYTLVSADLANTITCAVTATNVTGSASATSAATDSVGVQYGQQAYTSAGTYTWTAPAGVTKVSVVAVGGGGSGGHGSGPANNFPGGGGGGGGGLGYKNNITVVPGTTYSVVVGAGGQRQLYYTNYNAASANPVKGYPGGDSYFIDATTVKGGGGAGPIAAGSGAGGSYVGDGGGNGGVGKEPASGTFFTGGGGGGAGGYSGTGGAGGNYNAVAGAGAGGGGAGGNAYTSWGGAGGGGVGLLGTGTSGAVSGTAGNGNTAGGGGGSGGAAGARGDQSYPGGSYDGQWQVGGAGGGYGGGGGGAITEYGGEASGAGATGAVRIIWDYTGNGTRTFPSTLTTDL